MDPNDGSTCYMVPVGQGVQREYQDMFESFTCCVGTGMESHALHGYGLYYESKEKLWVNLYAPSVADWKTQDVHLSMDTSFPEGETASLVLTLKKPKEFTVALRRPLWAGNGFTVSVNGKAIKELPKPGSYVELKRTWHSGDVVKLTLPKTLRQEPLPDNLRRTALMWGPLVLVGDLGPEPQDDSTHISTPVIVAADRPMDQWLKPVAGKPNAFRTAGVAYDSAGSGKVMDIDFVPFYQLHRRTYSAYWDVYTQADWAAKSVEIAADQEKQQKLQAITVSYVQPGQMQSERDFNEQGEESRPDRVMERPCRRGRKWFSFDLPVDPAYAMALIVTYNSSEREIRNFDILVDGQKVGSQTVAPDADPKFFDVQYAVPGTVVAGKKKVTVRFEAAIGSQIAGVFGIRMIRVGNAR